MSKTKTLGKRIERLTGTSDDAEGINQKASYRAAAEFHYDRLLGMTVPEEHIVTRFWSFAQDHGITASDDVTAIRTLDDKFLATLNEPQTAFFLKVLDLLHEGQIPRTPQVDRDTYIAKYMRAEELRHMGRPGPPEERDELIDLNNWLWQVHERQRAVCSVCGRSNWDLAPGEGKVRTGISVSKPYCSTADFCDRCRKDPEVRARFLLDDWRYEQVKTVKV